MGKNKYPPLDREQVELILKNSGFTLKRTQGSHAHWEGYINNKRQIVTVDLSVGKKEKFGPRLLRNMIRQSGLNKKKFYSNL